MDSKEAQARFKKADKLFVYGRYEDVLLELRVLDEHFPNNHRILNARARTLERLGRFQEALADCDRLLNDFGYEKIRAFRDGVAHSLKSQNEAPQNAFWANEPAPARETPTALPEDESAGEENSGIGAGRAIRLIVLLLVFGGLAAGMYFGYVPYWIGGGIIGLYVFYKVAMFLIKKVVGRLLMRLFTAPVKAKGKALAGATCTLHGYEWTDRPADIDGEDEEESGPRRYVWLDVTITPQPRTEGFTHWEPGELMLAPLSMELKGLDSLEDCFQVHDYRLDGAASDEDDMGKFAGPLRLKLLAAVPPHESAFKFAYYFESFGELRLA